MIGIPLELDGATFAGANVEAAARRAFLAGRRVDDREARRDLLGLDDIGDQLLYGILATAGCSRASTHTDELQKIATIDFGH
jgi:hypothetical protein